METKRIAKKNEMYYRTGGITGIDLEWLRNRLKELYRYEGGYLVNDRGQKLRGMANNKGYRFLVMYIGGKQYRFQLHRMIYLYVYGSLPDRIVHLNGDKRDNRIENMRGYNDLGEMFGHYSISGIPFLKYDKSHSVSGCVWGARVKFKGRLVNLGNFSSFAEAKVEYDRALAQIASLNS